MFDREIKFIYDFNLNKVKQLGSSFTFNNLSSTGIHPAIVQYIAAEIDYLIFEDRKKLNEIANFDYSGERITNLFRLISEEIKKEKKLSIEFIDQLILHSASFNVNYLAQPNWSLIKLIFSKNDDVDIQELRHILKYVFFYDFQVNIIEKFLSKKKLLYIGKTDFTALLNKMDEELFEKYAENILQKVLTSLGEFYNIGSVHKSKIPFLALEVFLKEKKLNSYIDRLQEALYPEIKQSYDISELKQILFAPIPIKKSHYFDRLIKRDTPDSVFKSKSEKMKDKDSEETIEFNKQTETQIDKPVENESKKPESATINTDEINTKEQLVEDKNKTVELKSESFNNIHEESDLNDTEHAETEKNPSVDYSKEEKTSLEKDNAELIEEETERTSGEKNKNTVENGEVEESANNNNNEEIAELEIEPEYSDDDFVTVKEEDTKSDLEYSVISDDSDINDATINIEKYHDEKVEKTNLNEVDSVDMDVKENSDESEVQFEIEEEVQTEEANEGIEGKEDISEGLKNEKIQDEILKKESGTHEDNKSSQTVLVKKYEKDITEFFSGKDMDRIISVIFNDDTEDFALTFESISQCNSKDEALLIIDSVLNSYHIKSSIKEAALFKKIVIEYFNQ